MFKLIRLIAFASILLTFSQPSFSEVHRPLFDGLDGQKHFLDEYIGKGKWVVVNIWATSCPYCRNELFDLSSFHDKHHNNDAIVLGLTLDWPSFDFPDKVYLAKFAADYLIDYPLFIVNGDIAGEVVGQSIDMIPITFFFNPDGKLVYRLNGMVTEQALEKIIKNKNAPYSTGWAKNVPPIYKPKVE
ncbi:MAG TPA: TlpA disulfide reductase family protein [Methylophilaceae bacterium]|nr:TlpA disulfide reductase family protein [Methylophilaceae bacterium]HQC28739.1 TlpA disulfide reductase family protein [Methylotenera sp.]